MTTNGRTRVAIVDGCRTPFVKAWTEFQDLNAVDLAKMAVAELLNRTELDPKEIDEVVMGAVLPPVNAPNIAREVVLGLGLPPDIPGFDVSKACASGIQAITSAAESIVAGTNAVAIAGGVETLSNVPVPHSKKVVNALLEFSRAKGMADKFAALTKISPADLLPQQPELTEYSTGYTMGQHCEMMAKKNGISREDQDQYAFTSHQRAAAGLTDGRLTAEIAPVYVPPKYKPVLEDNIVRKNPDLSALAKLKPVFDRKFGTLTAGNSSPLTDGASAVLLMSEEMARSLGYKPKAFIKAYAYTALDPMDQLLIGPTYATARVLAQAGMKLKDIDLVDFHEAFAAQILSNLRCMASRRFAEEKLGLSEPVGEMDMEKFNVLGGSIAIGHPFGATGGRMVTTVTNELQRRNGQFGLVAVCAAGAMGVGMILERA